MPNWECIEWRGFYGEGWGTEIVPEAFAHPAKYSRALIRRIYQEMLDRGWLADGDTVIDPFGGVALGGLDAMRAGLHWTGCELEPRFVALGQANIDLWNRRYAAQMPHWGTARIVQGDSRKLGQVLADSDALVSSPPYASSDQDYKAGWARFHNGRDPLHANDSQREAQYGEMPGQLGAMPEGVVSSPPFPDGGAGDARTFGGIKNKKANWNETTGPGGITDYGTTPGQLAVMPASNAAISSPPFLQTSGGTGKGSSGHDPNGRISPELLLRHAAGNAAAEAYGADAANLGNMPAGEFKVEGYIAALCSPPFADSMVESGDPNYAHKFHGDQKEYGDTDGQLGAMPQGDATVSSPPFENSLNNGKTGSVFTTPARADGTALGLGESYGKDYGETPGQAGSLQGDTFWTAARSIVAETFAVLRPGAHAAWVVKGFVRNKKLVDFPDQWRQLCESVGFVTVAEVRAWVVEDKGTQLAMDGEDKRHVTERKSFFRRLAEKKGSPRIDWETVWLMEKTATLPLFAGINGAKVTT